MRCGIPTRGRDGAGPSISNEDLPSDPNSPKNAGSQPAQFVGAVSVRGSFLAEPTGTFYLAIKGKRRGAGELSRRRSISSGTLLGGPVLGCDGVIANLAANSDTASLTGQFTEAWNPVATAKAPPTDGFVAAC